MRPRKTSQRPLEVVEAGYDGAFTFVYSPPSRHPGRRDGRRQIAHPVKGRTDGTTGRGGPAPEPGSGRRGSSAATWKCWSRARAATIRPGSGGRSRHNKAVNFRRHRRSGPDGRSGDRRRHLTDPDRHRAPAQRHRRLRRAGWRLIRDRKAAPSADPPKAGQPSVLPVIAIFGPTAIGEDRSGDRTCRTASAKAGGPGRDQPRPDSGFTGPELISSAASPEATRPGSSTGCLSFRSIRVQRRAVQRSHPGRDRLGPGRGRRPILVGGTGLYLRSALSDLEMRPRSIGNFAGRSNSKSSPGAGSAPCRTPARLSARSIPTTASGWRG